MNGNSTKGFGSHIFPRFLTHSTVALNGWRPKLIASCPFVGDIGGMGKSKAQRGDLPYPIVTVRPFFRFLPDKQRVNALRDEASNVCLFNAILAGRSPLDRPWLKQSCVLFKAAEKGDAESARAIVELACHAATWVSSLESSNPNIMSLIARQRAIWPVPGSYDPSWDRGLAERLAKLGLGQNRRDVLPIFREAQGDEDHLPARRWAREAVRCCIITRNMQRQLRRLEKQEEENLRQKKLRIELAPAWAPKTKDLPDYSDKMRAMWGRFIRDVIRQQVPNYHLRPEWERQRNSCKAKTANRKQATIADFQNAILDDIAAALQTITAKETNKATSSGLL